MEASRSNREYSDLYYTWCAKLTLEAYYDPQYRLLQRSNSPDWQSRHLGIGLAVCRYGLTSYAQMLKKLNEEQTPFPSNQLYLYTHTTMVESQVESYLRMDTSHYAHAFDLCFMDCNGTVFMCDMAQKSIERILIIDHHGMGSIRDNALMYAREQRARG